MIKYSSNFESFTPLAQMLCDLYGDVTIDDMLGDMHMHYHDQRQKFFLAYDGDELIGLSQVSLRDEYVNGKQGELTDTVGYLEAIYVNPNYRKQHIAATLVNQCQDWAKNHGCREFLSDCTLDNEDSYHFHLKLGFIEAERNIFFRKEI